jgi:hypothetical protein
MYWYQFIKPEESSAWNYTNLKKRTKRVGGEELFCKKMIKTTLAGSLSLLNEKLLS